MATHNIDFDNTLGRGSETASSNALGLIDDYTIVRELGRGGFGSVYLVRDKTGNEYAVKGLPPDVSRNPELVRRVEENFRRVKDLTNEHIVALHPILYPKHIDFYDKTRDNLHAKPGDPLIVMNYVRGITLSEWRKRQPNGRVSPKKAAEIVRQIADAIDYAHCKQILHRDIKPSNVMIEERVGSFNCKVLDFGIAVEMPSQVWHSREEEVRDASGTPRYMAPEQWCGDPQGPGTDQYALAVLYFELVTGEVPFQSVFDTGDTERMKSAVLSCRPDLSIVPFGVRKAVRRALAKKLERRFSTCMEFANALRGVSPMHVAFIAAVALALFAVAVVVMTRWARSPEVSTVAPLAINETNDLPHVCRYGEWKEIVEATCVTPGLRIRVCTDDKCAAAETNSIPEALGHSRGCWITNKPPTCVEAGERSIFCTRCSEKQDTQPIGALGHVWGNWDETEEPKPGIAGKKERRCSRCLITEVKTVKPLPSPAPPQVDMGQLLQRANSFAEAGGDKKRSRNERYRSWCDCNETLEKVLKIDPDNPKAKRLKSRADNALETLRDHQDNATPFNTGVKDRNGLAF